ncbi:F-box domain-containing protein [Mycena kentingensis (nom. inval.)]|nr:F-box domain-containing protein [Mycena kentingensis (nom. inval.)]
MLTALFDSIPNEVLAEIFLRFIPTYPTCPPLFGVSSPTTLSQVSSLWRSLAVSIPCLWRSIAISADGDRNSPPATAQLAIAHTWLHRAGTLPLSVVFHGPRNPEISYHAEETDDYLAFNDLLQHSARWEYAEVQLPVTYVRRRRRTRELLTEHMPLLRQLCVQYNAYGLTTVTAPILSRAPKLRALALELLPTAQMQLAARVPWSQLTHIVLDEVELADSRGILRQTRSLVSCRLRICSTRAVPARDLPYTIALLSLKTLTIKASNWSWSQSPAALFWSLRIPNLEDLAIDENILRQHNVPDAAGFLREILARWQCALQQLHIKTCSDWPPSKTDWGTEFREVPLIRAEPYSWCLL